jgi:hypothetical protein
MTRPCDNRAVGTIIIRQSPVTGRRDADLRYLVCTRATFPAAGALPALHVDSRGDARAAVLAAVHPTGLRAAIPQRLASGWRDNRCQRAPGPRVGHQWQIWQVIARGEINSRWRAEHGADWRSRSDLQKMAHRTALYAGGLISPDQFAEEPGVDPAWIYWLQRLRLIELGQADIEFAAGLARGTLGVEGWFTPAEWA